MDEQLSQLESGKATQSFNLISVFRPPCITGRFDQELCESIAARLRPLQYALLSKLDTLLSKLSASNLQGLVLIGQTAQIVRHEITFELLPLYSLDGFQGAPA